MNVEDPAVIGFISACVFFLLGLWLGEREREQKRVHREWMERHQEHDEHATWWMKDQAKDLPAFLRRQAD